MTRPTFPALALLVSLAACGGGESGGAAATPPPASDPAAPPVVAPTPAPTAGAPTPPPAPRPAPPAPPPPAPPVAAPSAEPVELLHAVPAAIAVSSTYRDDAAQAAKLVDGDLETAWNSRTGDLAGAWIELAIPADASVSSISMTAGFTHTSASGADLFDGNHRVTQVRVLHDGAELGTFPLDPSSRFPQTIPVTGGGGTYRIEITGVQPGSRTDWRELCVSELRVLGTAPGARSGLSPAIGVGTLPGLPAPARPSPAPGGTPADEGAYFVMNDDALVRLGPDGAFRRIHDEGAALGRASDGALYLLVMDDGRTVARRLTGGTAGPPIAADRALGWPTAIAPLPGGDLWVLGLQGAAYFHHDAGAWTLIPRQQIGADLRDLALDAGGTPWIAGRESIYRWTGERFEATSVPAGASGFFQLIASAGGMLARSNGGMLEWSGEAWTPVALDVPGRAEPARASSAGALRDDGTLALAPVLDGPASVLVIAPRGGERRTIDLAALGIPRAGGVGPIAWDREGRIWAAIGSGGLAIVDPEGPTLVRWYAPGAVPALASPEGIVQIVLAGAIPTLPPAPEPDGHVRGRLTRGGQPYAAEVVMCTTPYDGRMRGTGYGTPCDPPPPDGYSTGTTAAADGSFDLWAVPEGRYQLAVELPDHEWWVMRSSVCCERMRRGQVTDLGTIEVPAGR